MSEIPTLRELNDAFLLHFEWDSPEGLSLLGLLARVPEAEALRRQHGAARALGWLDLPEARILRHHVQERFGCWGPPAFQRLVDWLVAEHGWKVDDAWGVPLGQTLTQLLTANESPADEGGYLPASDAADLFDLTLPEINRLCTNGTIRSRKPTADQREGKERRQVNVADLARWKLQQKGRG